VTERGLCRREKKVGRKEGLLEGWPRKNGEAERVRAERKCIRGARHRHALQTHNISQQQKRGKIKICESKEEARIKKIPENSERTLGREEKGK